MASCASCGAQMFWAVTQQNADMPVDVEPNPEGSLKIVGNKRNKKGNEVPLVEVVVQKDMLFEDPDVVYYMPHFATCPQGKDWSNSNAAKHMKGEVDLG